MQLLGMAVLNQDSVINTTRGLADSNIYSRSVTLLTMLRAFKTIKRSYALGVLFCDDGSVFCDGPASERVL